MSYEVQRLNSRHFLLIELALAGYDHREIAEASGVTAANVSAILNSPLGNAELSRRRAELQKSATAAHGSVIGNAKRIVEESAVEAATKMRTLMASDDKSISFRSAKDILDRTFGPTNVPQVANVTVINAEKMTVLMQALQEVRQSRNIVTTPVEQIISDDPKLVPSEVVA